MSKYFDRLKQLAHGVFFSFLRYLSHAFVPAGLFTFLTKLFLVVFFGQQWLDSVAFSIFLVFLVLFIVPFVQRFFYLVFADFHRFCCRSVYYQAFLLPGASLYSAIIAFLPVRLLYAGLLSFLIYSGFIWEAGTLSFYVRYIKAVFVYDVAPVAGPHGAFVDFMKQFFVDGTLKDSQGQQELYEDHFLHPLEFSALNLFIVRRFHTSVRTFMIEESMRKGTRVVRTAFHKDYNKKNLIGVGAIGTGVGAVIYYRQKQRELALKAEKNVIQREKIELHNHREREKIELHNHREREKTLVSIVERNGGLWGDKILYNSSLKELNEVRKAIKRLDGREVPGPTVAEVFKDFRATPEPPIDVYLWLPSLKGATSKVDLSKTYFVTGGSSVKGSKTAGTSENSFFKAIKDNGGGGFDN